MGKSTLSILLLFPVLNTKGKYSMNFLRNFTRSSNILVENYKHNCSRHKFIHDLQLNLSEEEAPYNLCLFHHPWISGLAFYSVLYSAAPDGRSSSWVHSAEVRVLDRPER